MTYHISLVVAVKLVEEYPQPYLMDNTWNIWPLALEWTLLLYLKWNIYHAVQESLVTERLYRTFDPLPVTDQMRNKWHFLKLWASLAVPTFHSYQRCCHHQPLLVTVELLLCCVIVPTQASLPFVVPFLFDRHWDQEVQRATKELRKPSLSKAIIRCYLKSYAVLGLFTFIEVRVWPTLEMSFLFVNTEQTITAPLSRLWTQHAVVCLTWSTVRLEFWYGLHHLPLLPCRKSLRWSSRSCWGR